jgi:Cu/Ag efflux protein CusF
MRALIVVLIVLVVGVLGLGFYRNWYSVTVNKEKFQEDTHRVQDKFQEDTHRIKEKFEGKPKEASGKVKTVEAAEHRFTLSTTSDPEPGMMVVCTDATKVWRNDHEAATFADLKTGDEVSVQFRERGGKNEATSVTIGRK